MSKLKIRIVLSIVISLGVIFAVYTTVFGAPLNFFSERAESHSAIGALTTYDGAIVTERDAYYFQLDAYNNSTKGDGHDCGSYDGPID
ncbi:MAG: hypothetical protein PVJ21_10610 [Anaerolineales bacterium]|jgi:hypothetical protein